MSHFSEFLPALADYLEARERESEAKAMGLDVTRLVGTRSADLLPDLEHRWNAAVVDAARTD